MNDHMLEVGEKTIVKSMDMEEVPKLSDWTDNEDPIFFDYNFPVLKREEQINWFKKKSSGTKRLFTIQDFDQNVIGYMSLRNVNIILRRAEFGIVLNPAVMNKGYGSDALKVLIKWFFEELGYRQLVLTVALYNKRALHIYKKLGFDYVSIIYETYDNPLFDPFSGENAAEYAKLFRKYRHQTYSKCIKMRLKKDRYKALKRQKVY